MAKKPNYELRTSSARAVAAPVLPYQPPKPRRSHRIGLIGCGGITDNHLKAYRNAGWEVVALCSAGGLSAEKRRKEFYPGARVCTDYREVLSRDDIEVVDVATHPHERYGIMLDAINAGKHILSQKPFVEDLRQGRKLVNLARRRGVKLAVNQNGRWAPHFSYMRQAVARGLIGDVFAVHLAVHWDHNWIKDTPFDRIRHIVLYDFGIHWFDILTTLMPGQPRRVHASFARSPDQQATPNLLAQAIIEYDHGQASLIFDAAVRHGPEDSSYIAGTLGTIQSIGPNLGSQQVILHTRRGIARPKLQGQWFPDGFAGTMGELLCAIEQDREPDNNAARNLNSLALCFAAIQSAETLRAAIPGKVTRLLM